ncbi:LuxR C-terminal-related transcriptional regulator [Novosphingobium resinovorum]|uniref:LuxR C-terminal-related transcriptional regulator n=1 Tax=Novosphingobium resinovorum TaxID=158500 RepID=UPI002ED1FA8D|nr:LuxR C-terminal-related transcriptional regulator [Novosphingobium resinovorum]
MTVSGRIVALAGLDDATETARSENRPDHSAVVHSAVVHSAEAPDLPTPFTIDLRLERLGALLDVQGTERVVQLHGPTGLGKTTLLATYALARRSPARQFRWLTVHPADLADEAAFARALAGALIPDATSEHGVIDENAGEPLRRVERHFRASSGAVVLVVDANALDIGALGRVLGDLVHWTGPALQVWLIARRPNAAMLACLRSPHLVRTLDPAALLFTAEEAQRYRGGAAQDGCAGGWPLAEAVAAALPAGEAGADRLLDHAGGLLEAAIDAGLWQGLSAQARKALADTAMLETVDERFLAGVLAPHPVYPVLQEIEALAPLGTARRGRDGGLSVHPLLRAFALRRLESEDPAGRDRAYRQALLYHAERRAPEAAIALVQDTGDDGLARMAFETFTSTELLRASGYSRLRTAMARLTPEAAEQSAQIRINQAIVAMKEGRFPEARRLLDSTRETLSEDMAYQSPSLSRVYADFVIAQHVLAFHAHAELTEAQLAEGYFWSTYTNDLTNAAFVSALRSLHFLRRGEIALAQEQIGISRNKYERATSYYGLGSALLVDAMIALASGRLSRAGALASEAQLLITRAMPDDAGLMAVAECVLCEVEFEQGRTEGLVDRVDAALRDLEACDGWPDAFVIGYRVGAHAAMAGGDQARALALLDRAIRLMRGRGLADVERYCRILRAGVLSSGAAADGEAGHLDAPGLIGWRESDEVALLDARRALAGGDHAALDRIVAGLQDQANGSGRRILAIRALLLAAVSEFERGQAGDAVKKLENAVTFAEGEEIVQPFADHGAALVLVLDALKVTPYYRAAGRGTRSFCASIGRMIAARAQEAEGGIVFVARELQVLHHIMLRQSTKAIARELDISISAVKFHLNNIYRKLGVNKRTDAVVEVQRLGLIV